jgi:hypothetical protein
MILTSDPRFDLYALAAKGHLPRPFAASINESFATARREGILTSGLAPQAVIAVFGELEDQGA